MNSGRIGGNEPGLNFPGDFQVAFHDDFVGEFQRKQEEKEDSGEQFEIEVEGELVAELEFERQKEEAGRWRQQKNAACGGQLIHQRPEELLDDREGALPAREIGDFFPVDVFAVEAVAGLGIGGELGPKIVDGAAFADALPEMCRCSIALGRGGGELGLVETGALMECQYRTLLSSAQPGAGNQESSRRREPPNWTESKPNLSRRRSVALVSFSSFSRRSAICAAREKRIAPARQFPRGCGRAEYGILECAVYRQKARADKHRQWI